MSYVTTLAKAARGTNASVPRFALRFGSDQSETEGSVIRAGAVRSAFNSPFWPFVLASTSVGQEGLDFHLYCHAIVHWNLPTNPVDLEQREGRVHRFKGHAVRRNIAHAYESQVRSLAGDRWESAFGLAVSDRAAGENDLVPYWVYPGPAAIERHVPALPLSREVGQLHDKIGSEIYKKSYDEAISKGTLEKSKEEFLDKLKNNLRLPDRIAEKISSESRNRFMDVQMGKIIEDGKISPEEFVILDVQKYELNENGQHILKTEETSK